MEMPKRTTLKRKTMIIGFHQNIASAHEKIPLRNWKREPQRTLHKNTPLEYPNIKRRAQQMLVKN